MHHSTDRITHTTAFVTPVVEHWVEREIAQWFHPMKDRSDDPSHHERTLLPRSYISLHFQKTPYLLSYVGLRRQNGRQNNNERKRKKKTVNGHALDVSNICTRYHAQRQVFVALRARCVLNYH